MTSRSTGFLMGVALTALALGGCAGSIEADADPARGTGAPQAPAAETGSAKSNAPAETSAAGPTAVAPSAPAAAAPVPNAAAEPKGIRGILNCPTTELPAYGNVSSATLSQPFQRNCAACHGGFGEGKEKYPAIPGTLTESQFVAKVRAGANAMPAFGADFVSDAQLAADFANLKKLAGQTGGAAAAANGPASWSDAKVDELYRKGLAIWRKAGTVDGQACTNCHSADGVELAIIGFTDDAILRRGQQHLSAEDALTVRDFIHAQRRRFNIARTCSPNWRPFQPGGEVLPGATKEQQDAAFLEVLKKRNLLVATGKVVSLEDAKKALAEIQAVDLRQLPIGIPLPRWSEDKFNGPEHRDINDYMAPVPTVPNRPAEYFAIEDAYLANPTDAGLYKILDENRRNMNDLGYAKKYAVPSVAGANCATFPNSTAWIMTRITQPKRLSVLVAAHLFREEIKAPGSFLRRPTVPFADAPAAVNPAFFLGGFAIEPPCYDSLNYPNWIKAFPEGFRAEFPEKDLARGVVENATDRVTHVWMTLGQIMDPSLIATDGMTENKIHYWAFRNFVQNQVHLPFVYVHRIATQTTYWNKMRGTPAFPKAVGPFNNASRDWLHPLLSTQNQQSAGLQSAVAPDSKTLPAAEVNRFKGNMIRMMMLLSRDLLQQGATLQADQNYDHCLAVDCQTKEMNGFVNSLRTHAGTAAGKAGFAAQGFDLELYEADTRRLLTEVIDLMVKAPKRK